VTDEVEIVHLAGHEWGEEMTLGMRVWYRVLRAVVVSVARTYFRARATGLEHVPTSGPFILSPIHRSNLDTPLVALVTRRRLRYMGKESLWKSKFGAWFLSGAGGFPVKRGTADREALHACQEVLERGEPLVLFPEGTRQAGPRCAHFFDGAAYLSCRTGAPIVPVGLGGTEAAMRKGSKMVYPVRMTVVVGEPLYPPERSESGRVSRKAVRAMTADLSDRIQALFDDAQRAAGRPNPPVPPVTDPDPASGPE
jgi:1-acyl-sn-glycerol-3-phosphate acyltransferase